MRKTIPVFILVVTVISTIVAGCNGNWHLGLGCGINIFQEVYSPNQEHKVVIYERSCGASTGFRTHISIIKNNYSVTANNLGNIFRASGNPAWLNIKVNWQDENYVVIEYDENITPSFIENSFQNIVVKYVENKEIISP
jgi:predicted small secreted protein